MNIEQEAQTRRSLTVYLPEESRQQVEAIAAETDRSMSKVVSILVKEALAQRTTAPTTQGRSDPRSGRTESLQSRLGTLRHKETLT